MARSKTIRKRKINPDAKYNSVTVTRLINRAMRSGKKSVTSHQIYTAFNIVEKQTGKKALEVLDDVLKAITPQMEVRSRRVGGAAYQVPIPVKTFRGTSLAIRWLITEANKRPNKEFHTFAEKLATEMIDALSETGGAYQRKLTSHKMAEANKAFAHFRW